MEKIINENNELKTTKSSLLINTSDDYVSILFCGVIMCISSLTILFCHKSVKYFLWTILLSAFLFAIVPVLRKIKSDKVKEKIEKNKNNYTYKIDGNIYELEMASQKEYYELKSKNYRFTILCNSFSVNKNGLAYVKREHSAISAPDAKVYIDKNVSETIRIHYNQITEIETGKILHPTELKQFLTQE